MKSVLNQSLVKRQELVKLGPGWFGGVTSRRAHQASRGNHHYPPILHSDGSTRSMKLLVENSYSTDVDTGVGA